MRTAFERARDGETGALEDLVHEFNPLLWHVARSQGLSSAEAADVVQSVWLVLLGKLDSIRTPAALPGWLITTTKREAWKTGRQRQRTTAGIDLAVFSDDHIDLDHRLVTEQRDRVLWRCVQQLSERCQALLRVVATVKRPDYQQVSISLGMPVGSIGPTRGRCLTKLREMLLLDPEWAS